MWLKKYLPNKIYTKPAKIDITRVSAHKAIPTLFSISGKQIRLLLNVSMAYTTNLLELSSRHAVPSCQSGSIMQRIANLIYNILK